MKEELQSLLEITSARHSHLCPRQVLGVRLGLAGINLLGFDGPPNDKSLLVITETGGGCTSREPSRSGAVRIAVSVFIKIG